MELSFSRRSFARLAAASAGAGVLTSSANAVAASPSAARAAGSFPPGFLWGSATASYQTEGAVHEDGRGQSIWDTFSHTPGKVKNNETGDIATDSYHRYPEDIALMKTLGLKACRFSVAWPRIFPNGTGTPNQAGVDHYRKLCTALLAAGIQPWCTLYHWDLPQPLQNAGGWQHPDLPRIFADYAGYTAEKLSDLCSHFMTMNEIFTFIDIGYGVGVHAPGLTLSKGALAQARHHAVLGHGLAVQSIRARTKAGTKIGCAENLKAIVPILDTPIEVDAARKAMLEENAAFLTVIRTGKYTDHYLQTLGADAPKFTPAEMKAIASPVDFQGLNIYGPVYVRASSAPIGYELVQDPKSYPYMVLPYMTIGPEALYWAPKLANDVFNLKEIYITENGCAAADTVAWDGHIYDTDRVMYLRSYLTQLQRAVSNGVPVKGYFLWSLLDNFEWAEGYGPRFGITYVDYKTQKRTPKLSSDFYKNVIAKNSL